MTMNKVYLVIEEWSADFDGGHDIRVFYSQEDAQKFTRNRIEEIKKEEEILANDSTTDVKETKNEEIKTTEEPKERKLSIKKGADPHGFIGKYQAIKAKSTAIAVAKDVFETICKMDNANQKYFYI